MILFRYLSDLVIIGVGVIAHFNTPPSVEEFGLVGVLGYVWAGMLVLGALSSMYGTACRSTRAWIFGNSFVAGGLALWAISALTQQDVTLTSLSIAGVLTAGVFSRLDYAVRFER